MEMIEEQDMKIDTGLIKDIMGLVDKSKEEVASQDLEERCMDHLASAEKEAGTGREEVV